MSRWFRHYAGMMRDEKLVSAAVRSKQPIERVVWIWGAILESAAEINDDGKFSLDTSEAAYFLRADQADLDRIVCLLEELGRIIGDRVVKWGDRQFTSDRSADRTRAYRKRQKGAADDDQNVTSSRDNVTVTTSDADVTSQSRHGDAPETDTELETDTEKESKKEAAPNGAPDPSIAERELFERGKQVLGRSAGGLVANLLKAKGGNVALARSAVEAASQKQNPREWIIKATGPPVGLALKDSKQQEWENARQKLRLAAYRDESSDAGGGSSDRILPAIGSQ